MAKEDVD